MTTKVIVEAHAGWPVDVAILPPAGLLAAPTLTRVAAHAVETFYVHSTADLHISEVQPEGAPSLNKPDRMMQFFSYQHLPPHLQAISKPFGDLAQAIVNTLPSNAERTAGLRKLLEAKDCAVRSLLYKEPELAFPIPPPV